MDFRTSTQNTCPLCWLGFPFSGQHGLPKSSADTGSIPPAVPGCYLPLGRGKEDKIKGAELTLRAHTMPPTGFFDHTMHSTANFGTGPGEKGIDRRISNGDV